MIWIFKEYFMCVCCLHNPVFRMNAWCPRSGEGFAFPEPESSARDKRSYSEPHPQPWAFYWEGFNLYAQDFSGSSASMVSTRGAVARLLTLRTGMPLTQTGILFLRPRQRSGTTVQSGSNLWWGFSKQDWAAAPNHCVPDSSDLGEGVPDSMAEMLPDCKLRCVAWVPKNACTHRHVHT